MVTYGRRSFLQFHGPRPRATKKEKEELGRASSVSNAPVIMSC